MLIHSLTRWRTECGAVAVLARRTRRTLLLLVEAKVVAVGASRARLPVPAGARRAVVAHWADLTLTRLGAPVAGRAVVAAHRQRVVHVAVVSARYRQRLALGTVVTDGALGGRRLLVDRTGGAVVALAAQAGGRGEAGRGAVGARRARRALVDGAQTRRVRKRSCGKSNRSETALRRLIEWIDLRYSMATFTCLYRTRTWQIYSIRHLLCIKITCVSMEF